MGERYLVTGAQLGMLKAYAYEERPEEVNNLLNSIIKSQFICDSDNMFNEDFNKVQKLFKE